MRRRASYRVPRRFTQSLARLDRPDRETCEAAGSCPSFDSEPGIGGNGAKYPRSRLDAFALGSNSISFTTSCAVETFTCYPFGTRVAGVISNL